MLKGNKLVFKFLFKTLKYGLIVSWIILKLTIKLTFITCILFFAFFSAAAMSEGSMHSFKTDRRAKLVKFDPHEIYKLNTHYLVSTDIILEDDELINTDGIHLGDIASWDISYFKNHLYVKAKTINAGGNLSVTTNKRSYHFVLSVSDASIDSDSQVLFLKFIYPKKINSKDNLGLQLASVPKDICQDKRKYNLQYSYTGNCAQAPIRACDDGIFTYFKFRNHIELPAIFYVLPDRKEAVVNLRVENDYVVVERIGKAFTLRNGDIVTSVYNNKYIGDWHKVRRRA